MMRRLSFHAAARPRMVVAIAAATLALASPRGATGAAAEWMPVSALRAGMRGEARTVVRGTAVDSFNVEVLDIVPRGGPSGDLILIRASGRVIEETGGIGAGMSGSPVFIDGRLVGAIGYGWSFSDHTLGLVTPIHDMLGALPSPRSELGPVRRRLSVPIVAGGRAYSEVVAAPSRAAAAIAAGASHTLTFVPVARPLLLSGMSPRAARVLQAELEASGLTLVETSTGSSTGVRPPMVPGSALGVQVMRGDVNAVAIGTLTYRRGNAIVGFGHAFLNRGSSAFLLTPVVIHGVVRSSAFPFKVGSAGAPVGTITEDRRAAIGGQIGPLPPMLAVLATVTDRDRNRTVRMGARVVQDPQLGPVLALVSAMEAVDRALDRVGAGTARVRLTLRARGLGTPLVRENTFYHERDIGSAALLELPEALRLLFANEFVRAGPVDVAVEADIEQGRQTAVLTEATSETRRVRRGDVIVVKVGLRPFQEPPSPRTLEIAVPDDFPTGAATVLVRAGGRQLPEQGLPALLTAEPAEPPPPSAAAQVSQFAERDRNTDIVVELIPGAARIPGGTGEASVQPARTRTATSWVVRGRFQIPVTVDPR